MEIDKKAILDILHLKGNSIEDRESEELEFKEQFSLSALPDYYRSFAGFANNKGGYMIFGIEDEARDPIGLNEKSLDQFKKIDPQRITQDLLEDFSAKIEWVQDEVLSNGKTFGVFKILESLRKPIIAKKNDGRKPSIKAGEIYYRYAGRTQRIQYAELEVIVQSRIEKIIEQWMDLMSKIAKVGPQNATILEISGDPSLDNDSLPIFTMDDVYLNKIKELNSRNTSDEENTNSPDFNKDVLPVIGVIPKLKENLLMLYPLSAKQLAQTVKEKLPSAKQNKIWQVIKENKMKDNVEFSVYNFRNKMQEDQFRESGKLANGIPSIYNDKAVEFILTTLKNQEESSKQTE